MAAKSISGEEWNRIKEEFVPYQNKNDFEMPDECRKYKDWQKVYMEGCDSKYGTIMVSYEMQAYRDPTMKEFYGGSGCWD